MSRTSIDLDIDYLRPGHFNALFRQSITGAIALAGGGLEGVRWEVRIERDEIFVLGTPEHDARHPMRLCRSWATALGLEEFSYDELLGISTWSRHEAPWLIELSAPTP